MPQEIPIVGYGLSNIFENLTFNEPVAIVSPPGETNRLFVVERTGSIVVITNLAAPNKTLFLDVSNNLHSGYVEAGLLGLAFHPGYATNRFLFIYRTLFTLTVGTGFSFHDQLSRFQTSTVDPNRGLEDSEVRLFAQRDLADVHNAGDLQFGLDGYLYVSLGDSSPPPAELTHYKQPIDKGFFGAILRIDVDKRAGSLAPNPHPGVTSNYSVPPDNPFIGLTNYQGIAVDPKEVRTEFYAIGFRNPWRMSFDPVTGRLFVGDVGDQLMEEVDIVVKGGNYGWPYREGFFARDSSLFPSPPGFGSLPPLAAYHHGNSAEQGACVVGGIVYWGQQIPRLRGSYLFGDAMRGNIWSLRYDGTTATNVPFQRLTADPGISAFGRDPRNGEVLVANFKKGIVQRLVFIPAEASPPFPQTLADTGAFADLLSLSPNAGIEPFELNVPFWSDHAIKSRWFAVPNPTQTIEFRPEENWLFPTGAVWIKHFDMEMIRGVKASRRRLETRFLVKNQAGVYGVTYRWGNSATNALLVAEGGLDETFLISDGGIIRTQVWHYPTRAECAACHSSAGGWALGFNTPQLNREVDYHGLAENQLRALSRAGYFQTEVTEVANLRALAHATNTDVPLEYRARSYLTANCVSCHQPAGETLQFSWDARITTRMADANILKYPYLTPNSFSGSWIFRRISPDTFGEVGFPRMPPIGSTVLDPTGHELISQWINSFPPAPWQFKDVGTPGRDGSSSLLGTTLTVSGSGADIGGTQDQFHYLYQPLRENSQLIVRLVKQQKPDPQAKAGVMLRSSAMEDSPYAMVLLRADGKLSFQRRVTAGSETLTDAGQIAASPVWLRLLKEGDRVGGYASMDRKNWTKIGEGTVRLEQDCLAGLAVTAHNNSAVNMATFEDFSLLTVRLASPDSESVATAPVTLPLTAEVKAVGHAVSKIEFFAGTEKIGESTSAPFSMVWSNALAGSYAVTAKALDASGAGVGSQPVTVTVMEPNALAVFAQSNSLTRGNWNGTYGSEGYVIAGDATNLPYSVLLSSGVQQETVWETSTDNLAALERAALPERVAAAWSSPSGLFLDLNLRDGQLHRITLYFLDGDSDNTRRQTVEVVDAQSQAVLDRRELSSFSAGLYLAWTVRGHVQIRIAPAGGQSAVLSGLFFDSDPHQPPSIEITHPAAGSSFVLPATIPISASASDPEKQVKKVEFFASGIKLGEVTVPPYVFAWSNVVEGDYTLAAAATDVLGATYLSRPIRISATAPPTDASFRGLEATTHGSWLGVYGDEGFVIVNHYTNYPAYALISPKRNEGFTYNEFSTNDYALDRVMDAGRIEAAWFTTSDFLVDLQLKDGHYHLVTLYFADLGLQERVEKVEILDTLSGRLLDTQTVSSFPGGKYYTWSVRGHVRFRFTHLRGGTAVLSGIFFDPDRNHPPVVRIVSPETGVTVPSPSRLTLTVEVSDPDGSIENVVLSEGSSQLATLTKPPYRWDWDHPPEGNYRLAATATDNAGRRAESSPVYLTIGKPLASASFLRSDANTQGNWIGVYGRDGFNVINHLRDDPAYAQVAAAGAASITWEELSKAERALRRTDSQRRIAAAWYSLSHFSIDLNMTDRQAHRVALYGLDWDSTTRRQKISMFDAQSGSLLDSRILSDFQNGQYLVWSVFGHVTIEISTLGNKTAVLSGLFFDPETNRAPAVILRAPDQGTAFTLPANIPLQAEVSPLNRSYRVVFLSGTDEIGESITPPYRFTWTNALQGVHFLSARATDTSGNTDVSETVAVVAEVREAGAVFQRVNTVTQGNWKGTYGRDGRNILGEDELYPAYARVRLDGYFPFDEPDDYFPWIWARSTDDARALELSSPPDRIAAAWTAGRHFTIDLNLQDGRDHQVALYCLDWDSGGRRAQNISWVDASNHRLLDSRDVTFFDQGKYLEWVVRGHVKMNISSLNSGNAVVSGLFFDRPTALAVWKASRFSLAELADPGISADAADPDADGILNLLEYKLGLNPRSITAEGLPSSRIAGGYFYFTYTLNKSATDVSLNLDFSTDLVTWKESSGVLQEVEVVESAETKTITVRGRDPVSATRQGFLRLRVESNR